MKPSSDNAPDVFTYKQIRRAIMQEIGTDERTIAVTINQLKELELISPFGLGLMMIDRVKANE